VRTQAELSRAGALPHWLGDPDFHRSHQSALLRKDPEHYGPLFPGRARRTCPKSGPRPLRLARGVRGTARSCLPTASTRPTTRSRMRPTTGHVEPSGPRWPPELGLGLGMPCRGAGLSTMSKSTRFRGGRSPTVEVDPIPWWSFSNRSRARETDATSRRRRLLLLAGSAWLIRSAVRASHSAGMSVPTWRRPACSSAITVSADARLAGEDAVHDRLDGLVAWSSLRRSLLTHGRAVPIGGQVSQVSCRFRPGRRLHRVRVGVAARLLVPACLDDVGLLVVGRRRFGVLVVAVRSSHDRQVPLAGGGSLTGAGAAGRCLPASRRRRGTRTRHPRRCAAGPIRARARRDRSPAPAAALRRRTARAGQGRAG
jgi:hypothetical protein